MNPKISNKARASDVKVCLIALAIATAMFAIALTFVGQLTQVSRTTIQGQAVAVVLADIFIFLAVVYQLPPFRKMEHSNVIGKSSKQRQAEAMFLLRIAYFPSEEIMLQASDVALKKGGIYMPLDGKDSYGDKPFILFADHKGEQTDFFYKNGASSFDNTPFDRTFALV